MGRQRLREWKERRAGHVGQSSQGHRVWQGQPCTGAGYGVGADQDQCHWLLPWPVPCWQPRRDCGTRQDVRSRRWNLSGSPETGFGQAYTFGLDQALCHRARQGVEGKPTKKPFPVPKQPANSRERSWNGNHSYWALQSWEHLLLCTLTRIGPAETRHDAQFVITSEFLSMAAILRC